MSRYARICLASVCLLCGALCYAAAPAVSKVEPPNWWPDHTMNPVRLLIRGTDLRGVAVKTSPGTAASNVRVNERGSYALLDLSIDRGLQPGDYPLSLQTAEGSVQAPFRLDAPLAPAGRFQGFSPDDVIYLIMPDRFANGDPANDDPAISRGLFGRANSHFYHGGDLQGVIDHLPYLKSLGVTALWLTPVYDNTNQLNRRQAVKGQPIADYHGYGTVDYYAIEEHLGTMELLRKLVDAAHAQGLKVIQDQVANHVGPAHSWVTDPPTPSWFHGTAAQHVNETWQIWTLPDPHASSQMQRDVLDGWFADALPDLNQEDPDVAQYEIQNALWWVGMAGFDGIRQDTLPYVPRTFWRRWSFDLKRQYPNLRAVGEVFDADPAVPSFFQGGVTQPDGIDSGIDSVFDFPVYFAIRDTFAKGGSLEKLSRILAQDRLYPRPQDLVTFLGNHDVARFMQEPGASAQKLKLAFTFLLTMRGTPTIYYGDEIAMRGGNDPDNRRDFPGGWKSDPHSAFEETGRTPEQKEIFDYVRHLNELRARLEPLRRGDFTLVSETAKTLIYSRRSSSGTAIVAINNGAAPAMLRLTSLADGSYRSQLAPGAELTVRDKAGSVQLPGYTAEIFFRPLP